MAPLQAILKRCHVIYIRCNLLSSEGENGEVASILVDEVQIDISGAVAAIPGVVTVAAVDGCAESVAQTAVQVREAVVVLIG